MKTWRKNVKSTRTFLGYTIELMNDGTANVFAPSGSFFGSADTTGSATSVGTPGVHAAVEYIVAQAKM